MQDSRSVPSSAAASSLARSCVGVSPRAPAAAPSTATAVGAPAPSSSTSLARLTWRHRPLLSLLHLTDILRALSGAPLSKLEVEDEDEDEQEEEEQHHEQHEDTHTDEQTKEVKEDDNLIV